MIKLFSTAASPMSSCENMGHLLCCLPEMPLPTNVGYDNIFRIIVMQFMDAQNMDIRSVKKSCVHIVHPDGRIIPFDNYNLFYRDEHQRTLAGIQEEQWQAVPLNVRGGEVNA